MKQRQLFQKPMLLLFFLFIATLAFSQVTEQWVARYNAPSSENDFAKFATVDDAGNVYVSGTTGSANIDITTIKYDAAGSQLWLKRYDSAEYDDEITDLAVDAAGNVYVTGYSGQYTNQTEYITLKYSAAGAQLWVRRYKAPGFTLNDAKATALATDAAGNVYVTGYSYGSDDRSDYATIKYDPAGAEVWVKRYDGPANSNDAANALAVDAAGNVYVTGTSEISLYGATDYATIKYSASGDVLWVNRYDGPENGYDGATSLAVDSSGNVYVTGESGAQFNGDYATIKYDVTGAQLWVQRYNGTGNGSDQAKSIAVDGAGNVYVTGKSSNTDNGSDFVTIKYDAAGNQLWLKRYNGPGRDVGMTQPLAVDAAGNVYVTGYGGTYPSNLDYVTIKYSTTGAQLWLKRYNGPDNVYGGANIYEVGNAVAVDASGNVYVTGGSAGSGTGNDYATVKYSPAGAELWVKRQNGLGKGGESASSLAVDASGNVYVTGKSYDVYGITVNYTTIKYNAAGAAVWMKQYKAPGTDINFPGGEYLSPSLAVDASGNVYVTGYTYDDSTSTDYVIIKYSTDGTELWVKRYNSPWNGSEIATAVAVDGTGNVYVTGKSTSYQDAVNDYVTVKYDETGTELWAKRYDGPVNNTDEATALVVDASGNVYVTGESYGGTGGFTTQIDYATIKYNAAGAELWVRRYNGPANDFDRAKALAVDASGNVYVTGESSGDYATIKYNAAGVELWVKRYSSPANGFDAANSLGVDGSGNVHIAGYPATIKYDAAGAVLWTKTAIIGNKLALDASGNVYVSGAADVYSDYTTIKYDAAGAEQWLKRYNGPGNSTDYAVDMAVDGSGNVYVTGTSVGDGTNADYATIKYAQTQTDRGVYDFTLINADYNQEIRELKDGDIINLAELGFPRLTMRANTSPAIVGSVVLRLSGPLSRRQVENFAPYTLFGDDGKRNYYGPAFPSGDYTLTATPYSASQGKGTKGTPLTVRFTITGTGTAVDSLILVNSDTDTDIKTLTNGDVIDLATLPTANLNIRAVTNPETVGSVVFNLDNQVIVQENQAPYAIGGDSYGDYRPWTLPVGQHTLTATPYSAKQVAGEKGKAHSVSFTVVNTSATTQVRAATPEKRVTEGQISGERLRATPNPFAEQTNITFSVPASGRTLLDVYDMKGVLVERLYEAQAEKGKAYRVSFKSKQLARGLYIVKLTTGRQVQSYKLVLIR